MIPPPPPPPEATDIFSISDQALADRLQFMEEIGFGNWGSVWLCRPKPDPGSPCSDSPHTLNDTKIAVKLVHRSKTSTTAARVRSLWNEMKVVRSFKHEPHPSVIQFYSFIITPSYALITMAFHPRLIPVEVTETHSKHWFRSLLSGVDFLHKRGVVHNDIKPANILLSPENVPVLVDFGFAERYDVKSTNAFHSNLSYGTPEYLSPERARGLPHDTRKSDVWSLGVTFFEILIGRTPFEHSEGEQFSTKEELEKYWNRTLRGKWVGSWKMSKNIENLLRRMILPNADLRCTASEAMKDDYWSQKGAPTASHRKATSVSHAPSLSLGLDKDVAKFLDIIPPWSPRANTDKEDAESARVQKHADDEENAPAEHEIAGRHNPGTHGKLDRRPSLVRSSHTRTQSQPRLQIAEAQGVNQTRKNAAMPSLLATLSPIKHSPPTAAVASPVATGKENAPAKITRVARKPLGPRGPTPPNSPLRSARPLDSKENAPARPLDKDKEKQARRSRVFKDVTSANRNVDSASTLAKAKVEKPKEYQAGSVRDRMREWERERARLREMEQLEERMKEVEEEREKAQREREEEEIRQREQERELEQRQQELELEYQRQLEHDRQLALEQERIQALEQDQGKYNMQHPEQGHNQLRIATRLASSVSPSTITPLSPLKEEPSELFGSPDCDYVRSGNESGLSVLRHGLKLSIDKTMRLYKSSAAALGRSTPVLNIMADADDDNVSRTSVSERQSWEDDALIRKAKSSLPVVRQAVRNEELAAANRLDRMTIWVRNVEKVVEDARQNFAASSNSTGPLPPLPLAPVSRRASLTRGNRSSRIPRKILAANHIFADGFESGAMEYTFTSSTGNSSNVQDSPKPEVPQIYDFTLPTIPSEQPSLALEAPTLPIPETPSRKRRATVVTRSPEPNRKKESLSVDTGSPSKRREKSKSQNDLARPITPVTKLQFELEKLSMPVRPQRLSAVVDRKLFIASSPTVVPINEDTVQEGIKDDLTSSPLHVEPYPPRVQVSSSANDLDTPGRKHLDDVYDRFLMSTAGVKRLGRGYQSNNAGPLSHIAPNVGSVSKRNQRFFLSTRKPMPPPVSSEDLRRASSVDEFGVICSAEMSSSNDPGKNTVSIVRKAFKSIVSGKATVVRS